jgi:Mg-chelatase subunit ChlD
MATFQLSETSPNYGETSTVPLLETEHGRMRRRQRGIDKKDLQAAKKHGVKHKHYYQSNGHTTYRYTYKEIVYIVDGVTGQEVTCYAVPLMLDMVASCSVRKKEHEEAQKNIRTNLESWTSNTVIVVDTSGSMRTSDVWGTKTRLGAVQSKA